MNKKIVTLAMAAAFVLGGVSLGFAAKVECTVDAVKGEAVTMTCQKADQLKAGDEVKVSVKKKVAIEGC